MWSPTGTFRIFWPGLTFAPSLGFRASGQTSEPHGPPPATWSPHFSETMHSDVTSLQLSCFICGKMLAALPKNLQKLGREKILDEKAAGAVCSPTWCTRFSAKCGHPLFTVISAACIVERPLFCRAMFVQPTSSPAWSPRNMFF